MLQKVREGRPSYNNNDRIANNTTISSIKLLYYYGFSYLFSFVGSFCNLIIVNSSWTARHIQKLWGISPSKFNVEEREEENDDEDDESDISDTVAEILANATTSNKTDNQKKKKQTRLKQVEIWGLKFLMKRALKMIPFANTIFNMIVNRQQIKDQIEYALIYPPCNTTLLQSIALNRPSHFRLSSYNNIVGYQEVSNSKTIDLSELEGKTIILSIGQFRPEKDHHLQIK
jgi:glycosyltransferase involved in cell wall biosynthesis